ncbi:MAG: DMT family transporter [Pseudomonadota bacterium]
MGASQNLIIRFAPIIFVLLWATGFPAAKFGTAASGPFIFLLIRFLAAFAILAILVFLVFGATKSDRQQVLHSILAGMLVQGVYLGGVFFAVSKGMPAGISALIVALQPFLTAVFAFFLLKEELPLLKACFFVVALFGVVLVLFPELSLFKAIPGVTPLTLGAAFASALGISYGTVYQKKYVTELNLWVTTMCHFIGGAIVMILGMWVFGVGELSWTLQSILTLAWLIFVLSIGAVALLMYLIRRDSSASVASLFFLVPVVAALMTWFLFGETMNAVQLLGGAIVVLSVAVTSRI